MLFRSHTIEAYNKLAVFAKSIADVQGHALYNFENITENNILKVESGAWAEGVQLTVHANQHNIAAIKKLKEIKVAKGNQSC